MKRKKLTKEQRLAIFNMYSGHCAYCGCVISENKFDVDHLKSVREMHGVMLNPENDVISNLVPSCRSCNRRKGSLPLECFRKSIEDQLNQFRKYGSSFAIMERYKQIKATPHKVKFYFEIEKDVK